MFVDLLFLPTDGVWSERSERIMLGLDPVTSMICVADTLWAASGNQMFSIDIDQCTIKVLLELQSIMIV